MGAYNIRIRGIVQGVGFRPYVYRLAHENTLAGWVLNGEEGVEIFLEGAEQDLETFVKQLECSAPAAARIDEIRIEESAPAGLRGFSIRESCRKTEPTTCISPDLSVCEECLRELFEPTDPRYSYPYINCTNCGPRYSLILGLPYDRQNTTMAAWILDDQCRKEYADPADRRFHAQPVACRVCGPTYHLRMGNQVAGSGMEAIERAARLLRQGFIVAVKGIGGYHLACDAQNALAVQHLRDRKFRKEKPFALMARSLELARRLVYLSAEAEELLVSVARPIVLSCAKTQLAGVAPETVELGVMLPYTPLHHLLFNAAAPDILVMTSANRSSEPIFYEDSEALEHLSSIADAFLVGERRIARRVDDSVVRFGVFGPSILRRSRGYAPAAAASIPTAQPILALGADLKNAITLVIDGKAFVSQHIGDLADYRSQRAFQETINDLLSMYDVPLSHLIVAYDAHPQYVSTLYALNLQVARSTPVQHHRAHVASVLAECEAWKKRVIGVSFDGTGYGDDGTIWGGEIFSGSVCDGFERIAHMRPVALPGGDAAARYPVQSAAGFLAQLDGLPDFSEAPFHLPHRFQDAQNLLEKGIRTFTSTSVGRLFDAVAALLGFTRPITFEGQAAIWLEQMALRSSATDAYAFPFEQNELDFRPLLCGVLDDVLCKRPREQIARCFQRGLAQGVAHAIATLCRVEETDTVVLSGGVFQNELLLCDLKELLDSSTISIWKNHKVPANDGGISLGQAAMAAFILEAPKNCNGRVHA